jgi:superfamily I DNA/RNA helicase
VQSIYGFRGAQSRLMSSLPNAVDFKLTKSFRFGPNIANIANLLIWIKENSPQVFDLHANFITLSLISQAKWFDPYQVEGVSDEVGVVFLDGFPPFPFTFIARINATLIAKGIEFAEKYPGVKIFIKGNWDNKFEDLAEECEDIYRLKMGERPKRKYKNFSSYERLKIHARMMEWSSCLSLIDLVEQYGTDLPEKMQFFRKVLSNLHALESEADIILSTAHQSKGLQYDNVMVCGNLLK